MNSKTFHHLLENRISDYKSRLLFQKRDGWSWKQITWLDFQTEVKSIASFLLDMDFKKGDKALIISTNSLECLFSEAAIFILGGISVPLSIDKQSENIDFILKDEDIRFVFVGDEETLKKYLSSSDKANDPEKIFIFSDYRTKPEDKIINYRNLVKFGFLKGKKLKDRLSEFSSSVSPDLPAFYFYSLNKQEKAVAKIMTQEIFLKLLQITNKKLRFLSNEDQSYSYLPSSDSFSKLINFLPVYIGSRGAIAETKKDFFSDVLEVMPTVMFLTKAGLEKKHKHLNNSTNGSRSLKKFFGGRLSYIFTDSSPGHETRSSFVSSGISIIELNELTIFSS